MLCSSQITCYQVIIAVHQENALKVIYVKKIKEYICHGFKHKALLTSLSKAKELLV